MTERDFPLFFGLFLWSRGCSIFLMCSTHQDCYVHQFSDDYVDVRYRLYRSEKNSAIAIAPCIRKISWKKKKEIFSQKFVLRFVPPKNMIALRRWSTVSMGTGGWSGRVCCCPSLCWFLPYSQRHTRNAVFKGFFFRSLVSFSSIIFPVIFTIPSFS